MDEEALKYSFDLFVKDGYKDSFDDYKKLISTDKEALGYSYELFAKDGYKDGIEDYKTLLGVGGVKPSKKKEPTGSVSPLGQDAFSSAFGAKQQAAIDASQGVVKDEGSKIYKLSPEAKGIVKAKSDLKQANIDLIGSTLRKGAAEQAAPKLQDFNQQQGGILDVNVAAQDYDATKTKYDTAYKAIADKAPQGVDKDEYVKKTLNVASVADEINNLQNELAGAGVTVDDYVVKVKNDALGFLNEGELKYYDALKTGDSATIAKAKTEFDADIDTKINDINSKLITLSGKKGFTGGGELVEDEIKKLKAEKQKLSDRKQDVVNNSPSAAYKKLTGASPEFLDADKDIKLTPAQKLDVAFAYTFRKFEKVAKKLDIDINDAIAGKSDVFLFPEFRGEMREDIDEFNRLRDALVDTAPIVQINRAPKGLGTTDTFLDMFARKAGNSLNRNFHIQNTRDVGANVLDLFNKSTVPLEGGNLDTNTGIKVLVSESQKKPDVKEQVADVLGFIVPIAVLSATGTGELALLNAATRAKRAGVVLNEFNALGQTILKTPVIGKMAKSAIPAFVGAQTAGTEETKRELNPLSLGAGSLIEQGFEKLPAGKYFKGVLTKLFGGGEIASKVASKATEYIGRGTAQVPAEFTEELVLNYIDSKSFGEFKNRMTEQFGDSTQNAVFVLSSFLLGSGVLGGTNVGDAAVGEANKMYEKLTPEEKQYVDAGVRLDTEDKRGDMLDALAVTAPDMDKPTKEAAIKGLTDVQAKLATVDGSGEYKIEGEVDGNKIVLEGSGVEDLDNAKDFVDTALNIYKDKLDADPNETVETLTGQTETPTITQETVVEQPSEERGVDVEGAVVKEGQPDVVTEKPVAEKEVYSVTDEKGRTVTYFSTTTEKDGLIKTEFNFNRSDKDASQRNKSLTGAPIEKALGDKYTIPKEEIPEGAKVVGVSEIRITKGGAGATVTFEVEGVKFQGEVRLNSNTTYDAELATLNAPTTTTQTQPSDTANLPQDVQDKIAKLRADEQADLRAAIPNIDDYKVDGEIDRDAILASPDADAYNKIYDKYDAPITVLLEQGKKEGVTEPIQAPVIKAQVVGTTNGFNTIIDGGLGKQQDPRFTGEVQQGKSIFKVQPNNNESSFLDISLPSYDSFGRSGGIQIRFELPNGVDANTVFEAVKKEAAKVGSLDAKDPNFKQTVQGLVDKGIAEIQGLATGGAKQTAQVKETVSEKQVAAPLKDVESFELVENEGEWKPTFSTYKGRAIANWVYNFLDKKQIKEYDKLRDKADNYGTKTQAEENLKLLQDFENNNKEAFEKAKKAIDDLKQAEEIADKDRAEMQEIYDKTANQLSKLSDAEFERLIGLINKNTKDTLEKRFGDRVVRKALFKNRISEDYHEAKANGSNPDLVKAVEELLAPNTNEQKATESTTTATTDTGTIADAGTGKAGEIKTAIPEDVIEELIKGGNKRGKALKELSPELESTARNITGVGFAKIKQILANEDGAFDKQLAQLEKKLGMKKIC